MKTANIVLIIANAVLIGVVIVLVKKLDNLDETVTAIEKKAQAVAESITNITERIRL